MEVQIESDLKRKKKITDLIKKKIIINMPEDSIEHIDFDDLNKRAISQPLVKHIFTADPSAHVFNGKIYIYPSHDIDAGDAFDDMGSHFAMEDYHVISMDSPDSEAIDHGLRCM